MARAPWCSEEIYGAAATFRDHCLRADGSLFVDRAIWTVEALEAVDARVATSIDDGKWLDKLEVQLEVLSSDEILLGAEAVFVLLLPQSDTHAETKRKHLQRVLALLPSAPEVPAQLNAAFDGGGVANFSSAKSWNPVLLRFILHLALKVKELPAAQQDSVLADPWAFRDLVDEVRTSTDQMMANAVKHLLFPDSFESIISPSQRTQLLHTFENRPEIREQADDDRKIAQIVELAAAASEGEFTLYDETFRAVWSGAPDPRWEEGVRLAEALYERPDFDEQERDYKIAVADLIAGARTALVADDSSWSGALERALKDRRQNLVSWRVRDRFLEWVNSDLDHSETGLRTLWSTGETGVREFVDALPNEPPLRGNGTRASIASFLLMGIDVHRYPFYKPSVHEGFRRALGLPRLATAPDIDPETTYRPEELAARLGLDGRRVREFLRTRYPRNDSEHGHAWALGADEAEAVVAHFASETDATSADALYADWIALLQGLRYRLLARGTDLRDLLDAQGLAWWLVSAHPPEGWSSEETAALEAFAQPAAASAASPTMPRPAGLLPPIDAEFASKLHLPSAWLAGLTEMLEDKKQLILYGPPGTGKTYIAQHLGEHIARRGGRYRLVQFHPSYTYEDFFEGYRPKLHDGGALSFELVPGALREIAAEAVADPARPYLLIIDEINRGNIAKIFGELYFLLEYRNAGIRLQYSRSEEFSLPANLFLLGTMNTADRSIALVDSALRRRFVFAELAPTKPPVDALLDRWLTAHDHDPSAAVLLRELNAAIDDEDFSIGPSYFITGDGSLPNLERIWESSIMPLLRERYYGTGEDLQRFELPALRKQLEADED
jgi:dynein-related subfamily AAA family protein